VYSSAVEFFAEMLVQSYVWEINWRSVRVVSGVVQTPDALIRMEAIWRAWEHLRLASALGIST
jgi:hypothetical protein